MNYFFDDPEARRRNAFEVAYDPGSELLLSRAKAQRPAVAPSGAVDSVKPQIAQRQQLERVRPSEAGLGFVKNYETFQPEVYDTDGSHTPTIGWGHVVRPDEPFIGGISRAEADRLFEDEIQKYADIVQRSVKVPLTQQQKDALTSLAYNATSAFNPGSSLLTALNAGDYTGAADAMLLYNHAGGKVSDGLVKRRAQERAMFLNGDYDSRH